MAENGLNCGINKTSIMATKITVPDIGDFENVEIIEILTKPGAVIKKNDPVVTLESDKSSVEVPSPFAGKISSLEVKIGDKVSKGSILATIEENQSGISENIKKEKNPQEIKQKKNEPLVLKEEEILPEKGDGTSTLDLSLSKVTTGSFFLIIAPGLVKTSIISTFSKSPMSGTIIFVAIIDVLIIPQFNLFSAI